MSPRDSGANTGFRGYFRCRRTHTHVFKKTLQWGFLVLKGGGSWEHKAQGQDIWMESETCVGFEQFEQFEQFAQWQTRRPVCLKVEGVIEGVKSLNTVEL